MVQNDVKGLVLSQKPLHFLGGGSKPNISYSNIFTAPKT